MQYGNKNDLADYIDWYGIDPELFKIEGAAPEKNLEEDYEMDI